MKRVVKNIQESNIINISECSEGVYIARTIGAPIKWGIVVARGYKSGYKLHALDYSLTDGNTYGDADGMYLQECIGYYINSWDFYQFPDFRSAMEYYLEQSK